MVEVAEAIGEIEPTRALLLKHYEQAPSLTCYRPWWLWTKKAANPMHPAACAWSTTWSANRLWWPRRNGWKGETLSEGNTTARCRKP